MGFGSGDRLKGWKGTTTTTTTTVYIQNGGCLQPQPLRTAIVTAKTVSHRPNCPCTPPVQLFSAIPSCAGGCTFGTSWGQDGVKLGSSWGEVGGNWRHDGVGGREKGSRCECQRRNPPRAIHAMLNFHTSLSNWHVNAPYS